MKLAEWFAKPQVAEPNQKGKVIGLPEPVKVYAVVSGRGHLFGSSCNPVRQTAISIFVDWFDEPWDQLVRSGYRVVECKLVPVREAPVA